MKYLVGLFPLLVVSLATASDPDPWHSLKEALPEKHRQEDVGRLATLVANASLIGALISGSQRIDVNISEQCRKDLDLLGLSISQGTDWALKMLDASAKLPAGLNKGSTLFFGSYEECLSLDYGVINRQKFVGSYCSVALSPQPYSPKLDLRSIISKNYRWDVCVPSTCTAKDVEISLGPELSDLGVDVSVSTCEVTMKAQFSVSQVVVIIVFAFLVLMVFFGTTFDIYVRMLNNSEDKQKQISTNLDVILMSFSAYSNAAKILDTNTPKGSMTSLNGIRFLSTTWIILWHFFYNIGFATDNTNEVNDQRFNFFFQPVLNSVLSVDSFFLIGGILVIYVNLRKLSKSSSNYWFEYYVHRYWRLTPPMALTIAFYFVWPLLGSGPNWMQMTSIDAQNCQLNWWAPFLYINNFYGLDRPCGDHIWYLANDMQFYMVSPIVFYAYYRWPKLGLGLNSLFTLTSVVTPFVLGVIYDIQPTTLFYSNAGTIAESFEIAYTKPYCRMGPYCVGMFLGYVLATRKTITMSKAIQLLGHCICLIFCLSTLYGVYGWNKGLYGNIYVNALYLATHRSVWALGVAWIIFACANGYGGIIDTFLSWKGFVPLSRLTYVAYLIHPMIVKGFVGYQREALDISSFLFVTIYLGLLVVIFSVAFFVALVIEAPFLGVEKVLLHPRRDRTIEASHQQVASDLSPAEQAINVAGVNYRTMDGQENGAFVLEN